MCQGFGQTRVSSAELFFSVGCELRSCPQCGRYPEMSHQWSCPNLHCCYQQSQFLDVGQSLTSAKRAAGGQDSIAVAARGTVFVLRWHRPLGGGEGVLLMLKLEAWCFQARLLVCKRDSCVFRCFKITFNLLGYSWSLSISIFNLDQVRISLPPPNSPRSLGTLAFQTGNTCSPPWCLGISSVWLLVRGISCHCLRIASLSACIH